MISLEPILNGSGKRVYTIVFSSNAPDPKHFDGSVLTDLDKDLTNQEIWIYEVPAVADVDLTSGDDFSVDLSGGTFTQITNTPTSRVPSPGAPGVAPFVADDNRDATISDDGNRIAFASTRNLVPNGNADGNPEIFLFNRTSAAFTQLTNTQDVVNNGTLVFSVFNDNPSLSSDGSLVAFISNGNLTGDNNDGNGRGNGEIYLANYNGSSFSNLRQVTKTKNDVAQATVNLFSPGRRLSRDGSMLAFESLASDPKANGANQSFHGVFVCALGSSSSSDSFTLIGTRPTAAPGDILRFPTFTDYNGSLQPSTLVFASALNFKTDGTFPTTASDGLNPSNVSSGPPFPTRAPEKSLLL